MRFAFKTANQYNAWSDILAATGAGSAVAALGEWGRR